ncbi:hypothetical protein JTB14_025960 [Gonioctena quinquepunctata]|nr:hypothetical protein JTB14_025960 [Gonioctena quinquepunctata]
MGEKAAKYCFLLREFLRHILKCLFDKHFVPQKNEVFERFKFNSRVQNLGEGIDSFITALHTLAEHCDYGTLKDQLIRDRILVSMLDSETTTIDTVKQVELQAARNIVLRKEGRGEQKPVKRSRSGSRSSEGQVKLPGETCRLKVQCVVLKVFGVEVAV